MSIRNFWSLTPGEAVVAWEAQNKGFHVFFPVKDIGIDLILIKKDEIEDKNRKPITIQVKGSRFWEWKYGSGGYGGWFKFSYKKLINKKDLIDYYVFVLFHAELKKGSERFKREFFIIPTRDLISRLSKYHKGGDMVNMYLGIINYKGETKAVDLRGVSKKTFHRDMSDPNRDYTRYWNNWKIS